MVQPLLVSFAAGSEGPWAVDRVMAVAGAVLPGVQRLAVVDGPGAALPADVAWVLRGAVGHARYSTRGELTELAARQEGLGRSRASCAALIPIRKNAAWWALAQDERRAIFQEQGNHTGIGLDYLPAIARRLHHSRDLGEPFDFLTWFEYAPADAGAFDDMLGRLRDTPEWRYVEREVDIRLHRT